MLENSPMFKEHWTIPIHICWKISENVFHVKEHIGSVGKFHRGYLNVLEMFAVSGGKHSLGNSVSPVV
jgi:hypothetical protein